MGRLTQDGTAEPVSRDQILRREGGQRNVQFPCSADHEQDWQPYRVDLYSCYMFDHRLQLINVLNYSKRFSEVATNMRYFVSIIVEQENIRSRCVHFDRIPPWMLGRLACVQDFL